MGKFPIDDVPEPCEYAGIPEQQDVNGPTISSEARRKRLYSFLLD